MKACKLHKENYYAGSTIAIFIQVSNMLLQNQPILL